MHIYDITQSVETGIPVWPGDTEYDFQQVGKIADGATVNVGRIEMSAHTGTHVDAPLHFADGAADAAGLPLGAYIGPCVVAQVDPAERGIRPEDLPEDLGDQVRRSPRVLLRTYKTRPAAFDEGMAHATPELADWLATHGAVLLGIDTDSMDAFESKRLPAHRRLMERGIGILEGIDLSAVQPGQYELVALPLKLVGADGSPVRAVLIQR